MRISAGELKGRKIRTGRTRAVRHGALRPTTSKVRESIFNILRDSIRDSRFIDLYAGTGAVGMEAISRGAEKVFFVDADKKNGAMIEDLLKEYGCGAKAYVFKGKALDFVSRALKEGLKFDIIFLDPPYYSEELEDILSFLSDGRMLSDEGVVIAEHLSKKRFPDEIGKLRQKKAYRYGDTMLTLFRKTAGL